MTYPSSIGVDDFEKHDRLWLATGSEIIDAFRVQDAG
jgi:hypothetical protein